MRRIGLIVKTSKNDVVEPQKVEKEPVKAEKNVKGKKKTKELEPDGE